MLFLAFRQMKKYKKTYILYLINEKRIVLKKLGQLNFILNDLSLYVLHINLFLFFKILQKSCFISECFFSFLFKIKN